MFIYTKQGSIAQRCAI